MKKEEVSYKKSDSVVIKISSLEKTKMQEHNPRVINNKGLKVKTKAYKIKTPHGSEIIVKPMRRIGLRGSIDQNVKSVHKILENINIVTSKKV